MKDLVNNSISRVPTSRHFNWIPKMTRSRQRHLRTIWSSKLVKLKKVSISCRWKVIQRVLVALECRELRIRWLKMVWWVSWTRPSNQLKAISLPSRCKQASLTSFWKQLWRKRSPRIRFRFQGPSTTLLASLRRAGSTMLKQTSCRVTINTASKCRIKSTGRQ